MKLGEPFGVHYLRFDVNLNLMSDSWRAFRYVITW
jgi:hypothetical protein